MLLLLKRRIQLSYFLLPCSSSIPAAHETTLIPFTHHLLTTINGFSTDTTQNPSPKFSYIVEYLISSCGFPRDKAIKASKHLNHIKSPSKPDSVIRFLEHNGLSDTQIRTLISKYPRMLCVNVERTLEPRIRQLREMGFSEPEIVQLVEIPSALRARDLQPKIALWKSLFRTNEALLKVLRSNPQLLSASLGKNIMPNISLLRGYGISDRGIARFVSSTRYINPTSIKETVKRADELGFSHSSGMFIYALECLLAISRSTLSAKLKLLKSLGWSEAEVLSAIRKQPVLLNLSEKKIRDGIEFLVKEAGCKLSYVACRPQLLFYSLERRVVPRYCVLKILKQEELPGSGYDLFSLVLYSENKFIEQFILPHEVKIPGLHEAYVAACSGKVPIQWKD